MQQMPNNGDEQSLGSGKFHGRKPDCRRAAVEEAQLRLLALLPPAATGNLIPYLQLMFIGDKLQIPG